MTYNLVKTSIPSLIDKQLAMKIARINNIDYTTGIALPELPKLPSQFELLCNDIKESIFLFIRKHIFTISIIIGIVILLTIRYYQVQRDKKIKAEQLKILQKEVKNNNINMDIKNIIKQHDSINMDVKNIIKHSDNINNISVIEPNNEIDTIRKSFINYDDTKIKKSILNGIIGNNQLQYNSLNNNTTNYDKYHSAYF